MAKSVTIDVDAGSGALAIDDGALFLGEQAPVTFTGVTLDTGHTVRLTLFGVDGVTPIADNHTDTGVLDLRGEEMQKIFNVALARGAMAFHSEAIELDEDGEATGQVLAKGMIAVNWSPVVYEPVSGAVATLKGDTGEKGEKGDKGETGSPGYYTAMRDEGGKWHEVWLAANSEGEKVLVVDEDEFEGLFVVDDEILYLEGKAAQRFVYDNETLYLNGI